jgi:hypothetical protein
VDFDKMFADGAKIMAAYNKAREDLEARIPDMENAVSSYTNAVKQCQAVYQKEDFQLDTKNRDNVKKIQAAQKIFAALWSQMMTTGKNWTTELDELDKHVILLSKYKGLSRS